ncbi:MAG: hypothetical protein KKF14_13255 [Alphaproteobacteria bacterium]|nr:hypothetical protein [Alphaproteobacteria bacterium]
MFLTNDPTTEIVAHFLGYFELAVEAMRTRLGYEQIEAAAASDQLDPALEQHSAEITQKFTLGAYQPGVDYIPPTWEIRGHSPIEDIAAPAPFSRIHLPPIAADDSAMRQHTQAMASGPFIGPEPGSVIAIIAQSITLSDDDIVVLGEYDGPLAFQSGAAAGIALLRGAATAISSPVTDASGMHTERDVPRFVEHVAEVFEQLASSEPPPDTIINITDDIEGTYVNGEMVETAPDLIEALPEHLKGMMGDDEAAPEEPTETIVEVALSGDEVAGTVTLEAGGNLLVNEAAFVNAGVGGAIFAIGGDLHQLDVIIQSNAYFDTDTVDAGVPGAAQNLPGTTTAINSASFVQEIRDAIGETAEANPGVMPANWQVSIVSGDLVFIEWLSQFTFASDQDISVLSSTGANTVVTTGENVGLNGVSFVNLGLHFDLIIVGGNLYDANIIVQTNVLYDNDTIRMLGESSAGTGGLSTSGNLLWNEASIHNVGPTSFVDEMPDHYQAAMDDLDNGDFGMPTGFASDMQFEGFEMLRVLYVAGNIYDLRYVEQTNILGDADMVALQKAALIEGQPEAQWDINTGANALVNIATITDFDGMGDMAYVDGQVYSDAILIQAEILAADNGYAGGDALVTEVIAFLDVDMEPDLFQDSGLGTTPPAADGPPADIIQSVLA